MSAISGLFKRPEEVEIRKAETRAYIRDFTTTCPLTKAYPRSFTGTWWSVRLPLWEDAE